MKNLLTGLYSKFSGSDFSSDVAGRIYLDQAPDGCEFPYAVFFIVSNVPDRTFTETFDYTLIQFDLFSELYSTSESEGMFGHLKTLFDECASMTITERTLLWMRRQNAFLMSEEIAKGDIWHYVVEYEILTMRVAAAVTPEAVVQDRIWQSDDDREWTTDDEREWVNV